MKNCEYFLKQVTPLLGFATFSCAFSRLPVLQLLVLYCKFSKDFIFSKSFTLTAKIQPEFPLIMWSSVSTIPIGEVSTRSIFPSHVLFST